MLRSLVWGRQSVMTMKRCGGPKCEKTCWHNPCKLPKGMPKQQMTKALEWRCHKPSHDPHKKNTARRNMSCAVCASSMYSRLWMKMSSFLFERAWAMPRKLHLSCGIPFPVWMTGIISGLTSFVVWLSRWEVIHFLCHLDFWGCLHILGHPYFCQNPT